MSRPSFRAEGKGTGSNNRLHHANTTRLRRVGGTTSLRPMTPSRHNPFPRWLSALRRISTRWAERASTTRSTPGHEASTNNEPQSRYDPCSILARKGIPSAVWFEDALFFYGSDTAVFDLYMLVPDVGAASAILQSDGFRETGVGSLFPNDERASRASGGVRLKRVGADEDADGTVLLGAADWKFDLRNTELSSPAPVPQLSSFLESIMERWLSMSGEVCDEHYLWFLSLANLIGYAYTLQGPNRELVRRPEYAEQLQPRFRELHYDMVAEYPKKSGILSYGKHEYHVIRYREIQEGKFTPRPYPSGNFPPSLAEYPRLTGLDASTPTPRRKRRSPKPLQSIDEIVA